MKRVLSLVLALVMVLGMIPTFAAEMTGGEHLLKHGFITGKPGDDVATKLDAGAALTRQELAALIAELMGEKEIAAVFAQPADYADADKIGAWAVPFVAYAQVNGWMSGKPGNMFDPTGPVPGQQLAAVLMNALGYTVDTQAKYATVIADAAGLGLAVPSGNLTRGEAFTAMWTAVSEVKVNGEEQTLGVKLGKLTPPAPVVTALEVVSVTATNLKEIVVKFNQSVDKDTVVAANFAVSPTAGTLTPVLGEDGMTVTITTQNTLTNQGAYTLTVEKVESVTEQVIAKVSKAFTAFDATLPTVESIVVTGPKTFDVIFSEPITGTGTVTVKSANTTLAVQSASANGTNKVSVVLFTELADGTTYDVTIKDYSDFAGYNNVIRTIAYTYAKDTTAPVVELVSANQQYVVVKFNKPVSGIDLNYFYHTFSAWKPMGIYATKAHMDAGTPQITTATPNVTTVYVQFATTGAAGQFPLQPGNVNVNVLGNLGTTATAVKDNWGNALVTTVLVANIIADLEAPTVTKVEATSNTTIDITFSKAVAPGTVANYEVLKSDGTAVSGLTITSVTALSATKVQLTLSKNMIGETVLVNVKNIEDTTLNKNKLVGTASNTITFEDKQFDGVSRVEFDEVNSLLYVVYNESMSDTAVNIANYKVNDGGTIRSLTGPATFFGGNKVVKIELTATQAGWISVGVDKLLISNAVKDLAGNGPSAFQLEPTIVAIGSVPPVVQEIAGVKQIKAINKNTVSVQFTQELYTVNPTDFVLNNAGAHAPTSLALATNSIGTLVTLTFDSDIAPNAVGATLQAAFTTTVNAFNVKPTNFGATAVLDRIAPKLLTKELTAVDTIVLTYDENIKPGTVSLYTYTVAGNTVIGAVHNLNEVVLTLGTNVATSATPSVTQAIDIEDVAGNKLVASATAFVAADKVAPTVTFAPANAATNVAADAVITLTFSEAILKADGTVITNADLAAILTLKVDDAAGANIAFTATINAGKTVITITPDADLTAGGVVYVAIAVDSVEDAAGNQNAAANATFTVAP